MMEKKYILAFGFRRLAACKKLGYKNIQALLHPSKKVQEVPIDSIDIRENTRLDDSSTGFEELMQSIKDNGLLQPIGIWKIDDLTEEQYLTINLIENMHRKDITPYEMSKAIRALLDLGLNIGQIAVRLAQPKARIQGLINLTHSKELIEEFKTSSFIGENKKDTKGKLPFAIVNSVANARISVKQKKSILDLAKEKELSTRDTRNLINLVVSGKTFVQAKSLLSNIETITLTLVVDSKVASKYLSGKKQYLDLKKHKELARVIRDMLKQKIPIDYSLFV